MTRPREDLNGPLRNGCLVRVWHNVSGRPRVKEWGMLYGVSHPTDGIQTFYVFSSSDGKARRHLWNAFDFSETVLWLELMERLNTTSQ